MELEKDLLPFRDSQEAKPVAHCRRCGREIYGKHGECGYCRRFGL